jgi:tetratricopeptide (TPR) repeat protein
LNQHEQSLADFRFSHAQRPDDDWCLRHIAWILLGGPPELRDTQEALRLAEEAERIARERKRDNLPLCLAAIGMARYRLGEFDAALAALDKAIKSGAANARTLLFAAMCHHQLGDRESARLYYAEALHRIERQTRDDGLGDPKYVHAEAEELLEVTQKPH